MGLWTKILPFLRTAKDSLAGDSKESNVVLNDKQPDGLRHLMTIALFGGGIVMTLFLVAFTLIVWLGGWEKTMQGKQLEILGWGMLGALALIGIVLLSFAVGGPVGRLKGGLGLASFEATGLSSGVEVVTKVQPVVPEEPEVGEQPDCKEAPEC